MTDADARTRDALVAECVRVSRLLGDDPAMVLHGGGNSSVKVTEIDVTGRPIETLRVKGSGWDMASIEPAGLTALRLDRLHELLALAALPDAAMMRELAAAKLDPSAPQPSVESLLHALLPHRFVLHSHADAIVALTNNTRPEAILAEVFGDAVLVIPYVMPGFDLARVVAEAWPRDSTERTEGIVLRNHGLFTFGPLADEAFERHLRLVRLANAWLDEHAPARGTPAPARLPGSDPVELAELRRSLSRAAGRPMVVTCHADPDVARFVARSDLPDLAARGPLTPDHVIRTKRVPLVGRDVEAYAQRYGRYVAEHRSRARAPLTLLDPAPRIVLDPSLGMLAAGPTARDAAIAADVYRHTMAVLERVEDGLGGYRALPPGDIFDVEYWELEQAKLRAAGSPRPFDGEVALVTGAASGIGRASVVALLERGAAVVGIDRAPGVVDAFAGPAFLGVVADVTDADAQRKAVGAAVDRFGGVDIVVASAGVFPATRAIADHDAGAWGEAFAVNVDAVATLLALTHPLLVRAPAGGRVVIVASRNVRAPGPGASAYSASKAALTQLARVAALEWAPDGIRVNIVHPDAVFDTGLWTAELLAQRAARYGMTVDEYRRRNLLRREVPSASVGRLVAELCGDTFEATTGAQIPIDGGNDRVI